MQDASDLIGCFNDTTQFHVCQVYIHKTQDQQRFFRIYRVEPV